jgi:hypothetical protein
MVAGRLAGTVSLAGVDLRRNRAIGEAPFDNLQNGLLPL